MKRVNFYYSTKLTFDDYVHDHSFALRIIPPETDTQKIVFCGLNISRYGISSSERSLIAA